MDDICVFCKEKIDGRIFTEKGLKEYEISGICEVCYDSLATEMLEEDEY